MDAKSAQAQRTNLWFRLKLNQLLPELLVVFTGVFAAFLLSAYQAERQKEQQRIEIVRAVRIDLVAYIENGSDPKQGFVNYFTEINRSNQMQLKKHRLERLPGVIFGDYWHLEGVNMMLASGRLNDIDLTLYRSLARFNTLHQNFLKMIEGYNQYQLQYLMPHLVQQPFFQADGALAPGYESIAMYPKQLQRFSEVTVKIAQELLGDIDKKYPELKPPAQSETPAE
ncbi:MAG: hypothetical protein U5L02_15805 [Rheinheimera sp.]|nr:hypothetical protein [Rheinheimera sp.]